MKKLVTLVAALGAAICCMAAKPVTLSLNLEKGGTYGIKSEVSTTITQNVFGQQVDVDMAITGDILFKVDGADAEGYNMSVWYERLAMKMSGASEMQADSANDDGSEFSAAMKALTGKPFTIRMLKSGKITKVEGVEAMLEAMAVELGEKFPDMNEAMLEAMKKQLADSYGGEAFKGSIESSMVAFPDKPVSVGDSWTGTTRMQGQFAMNVESVFTVTAINAAGITIRSEATMTADADSAPVELNGMKAKYNLKGTMTSETVIDAASHWTVSGKIAQNISGSVDILPGDQIPNGLNIPMTMKADSNITGSISK